VDYTEMLRRTTPEQVGTLHPESAEAEAALTRFSEFMRDLKPDQVRAQACDVYGDAAILYDTLTTRIGNAAIRDYFARTAEKAEAVRIEIQEAVPHGHDWYLRWNMAITWKLFSRHTTESVGMSHIRFGGDGRVALHYDFWDSGSHFYQHIPLLGWVIRQIKRRA